MSQIAPFVRRLTAVAALAIAAVVAGCGGGGSADVVVVASPPPVTALGIVLTRTGPEAVQVDWTDDPLVDTFTVDRDGVAFTNVKSTTLIDNSVLFGQSYCYQVFGYDRAGNLIAASDQACIAIV